jgi:thioredoxin-related protein
MKSQVFFALLFCLILCGDSYAQTAGHSDSAFAKAKMEAKPVLLLFSGSDWCTNCMRFDKKIMHDAIFKDYLANHLVLFNADFPQQKKLPVEIVKQNDSLAQIYNADGTFPKIVLIDPIQPGIYKQIAYTTQTAAEFISEIEKLMPTIRSHE